MLDLTYQECTQYKTPCLMERYIPTILTKQKSWFLSHFSELQELKDANKLNKSLKPNYESLSSSVTQTQANIQILTANGEQLQQVSTWRIYGYRSSHTKPTHTWVKSPHFWSSHPMYEIKKDYSEQGGGLEYLTPIVTVSTTHLSDHLKWCLVNKMLKMFLTS